MIIYSRKIFPLHCILSALLIIAVTPLSSYAVDSLLDVMENELQREMKELGTQEISPYFMSYGVSDVYSMSISASFGALTYSNDSESRVLSVKVRVGDYRLDNTHELRGQYAFSGGGYFPVALDNNHDALRSALWQETNTQYRSATERFIKVKTNVAIKVAEEDSSADFSHEPEIVDFYEPPVDIPALVGDSAKWEEKVKKYSALFLANENIYGGSASFGFTVERKNLVTTEGSRLSQNLMYARFSVSGFIKSDDGMELPIYKTYFAFEPESLPDDAAILAEISEMIEKLEMLRDTPVVDPYTGPAILSGRTAGVFFHEILGHRIEGHRQKSEYEGQTFKKHIDKKILPDHMNIVFNPTLKTYSGENLMGYYKYDDEGIKARPVTIFDSGKLTGFLMSRSPIENFSTSNGHGRAQAGYQPVSRQSNMLIETTKPVSDRELREKLIALCKEQGKTYGLYFKDVQGGFTFTGRSLPNSFNLLPTEVYRIYTDGRPDELVRGVDLVGTPLVMLSMITDAGETSEIFNGICGAESGSVPVSAISPSLLVTQVEVEKQSKSQESSPILPRPDSAGKTLNR
ncbi:metallopeptidase TldD-related protein [Candidatus Latescibacterota bacterium]